MNKLNEIFGSNVFNDGVMKERLPKSTYKSIKKTIDNGVSLDPSIADVIAEAMMNWAIEKGATHFTHWFQPLTGITAEKHDSFISKAQDGNIILEFSGKELIKGEPDASSFPSGGIRDTAEARGYTVWDCTSPAFIKDGTLCIPTAFCSYTGEALDKKTPLLRSMEALSVQALRVLKLLGNTSSKRVITTVGPEQEYFLVDKKLYDQRPDLLLTGRTLFGAMPPKGQELDDHYFGVFKDRVSAFMKEIDEELWKLGVFAKTKHNEVAPAQHELACIFTSANIATDHNQLTMEIMKKVALRNDMVCLLHEKPFAGINGSGKHNNWSIATDDGINLLGPGLTPHDNEVFLIFLTAVIKAVDEYADLLRVAAANPGNDHRLGANEAPPAIISIFVGEQLQDILDQLENGMATSSKSTSKLEINVTTLPDLSKDTTDRNRTSPFAFTGNRFEFRMVPSSASIAAPNFTLNTIVAEILWQVAERLEKAPDITLEVKNILTETVKNHKRVIYNGNGYTDEWIVEAEKRGLLNIKTTVESIKALVDEKNLAVMEKHGVLSRVEMHSRYEISLENYIKVVNIEALTTIDIAKREILPVAVKFATNMAQSINKINAAGIGADISAQSDLLIEVSSLAALLRKNIIILEASVAKTVNLSGDTYEEAYAYRFDVFEKMSLVRAAADKLETIVDKALWPFPTYSDLLFKL